MIKCPNYVFCKEDRAPLQSWLACVVGKNLQLSFSLRSWQAYSPYHHNLADWQAWSIQRTLPSKEATTPSLTFVPMMQRRRLNLPAKLMFAALHGVQMTDTTPLVFAAHDGEINRAFALWLQFLNEGIMSPMSFGLSVHNALSGLWSLFSGNTAEMSAVSASGAVLETALLEAVPMLDDGAAEVVVVVVEDPLATDYDIAAAIRAPFPYALALRIAKGDDYRLYFDGKSEFALPTHYSGALDWIAATCTGCTHWTQHDSNGVWQWQQPC